MTEGLDRALGVRALAASLVNVTIGSGIFVMPAVIAAILGPASIVAYVTCAIAAGLVALCYAELGSRVTTTGGTYAYVEKAFGGYAGFLAGALLWFGGDTIGVAAIAIIWVESIAVLLPRAAEPLPRAILVVALFAALALVNVRGVRDGARLVELITAVKVIPLVLIVIAGFFAAEGRHITWSHTPSLSEISRATLMLTFAFSGVETALEPSGEVKNPARTVPRAIFVGLLVVTAVYVGVQLAAQGILGPDLVSEQRAPLAAAAERSLGSWGRSMILVAAIVSTFGAVAGNMLATPRVLFAFARDGLMPSRLAAVHARYRTPYVAILVNAAIGCGLALTGSFRALAVLSVVPSALIYLTCCLATLELRRRDVRADGVPFRAPGGPLVPLAGSLVMLWLLTSAGVAELMVVAAILAVASVLFLFRRKSLTSQRFRGLDATRPQRGQETA